VNLYASELKNRMKYLLALPVFILCSAFLRKTPESVPEYAVAYSKPAPALPKGTAEVIFTFSDENGLVKDSIRMSYNGKEKKVKPKADGTVTLSLKAGKYRFQFYLDENHYEISTDSIAVKALYSTGINVWFSTSLYPVEAEKPVIYFYPDATQQVNVQLDVNGQLGFTYPAYHNGWNFTADPDGTIHMNDKQYDYLFWDGSMRVPASAVTSGTGFIVNRDSLTNFFEEKLTAMGLNAREQQDFITYWCPRMQERESYFIHFMFNADYNACAKMNITPEPDCIFRVFMLWGDGSGISCNAIQEQQPETFTRKGFTVVEWGGAETDFMTDITTAQ
jgi:hypothetical protein